MKKYLALLLAVLLTLALFAGCNNSGTTTTPAPADGGATSAPATKAPATQAPGNGGEATAAPVEDEGPYHLAAGKYAKNADGYPVSKYEYTQPLCDNDFILTDWTTCYTPQYIPEGGWGEVPTWAQVREMTGVHVEYNIIDSNNRSQNFSVLLASDELDDMMDQASSFYKQGTMKNGVEDGFFANFYDYLDYLPNYMYEIGKRSEFNKSVRGKLFYDATTIPVLYGMVCNPCPAMGYFLRQDWMDKLGLGKAGDVKTYDQFHDVITAFKVNCSNNQYNQCEIYPLFIMNIVESYQGALFSGYDTTVYTSSLAYPRVKDGVVDFCGATEDDRAAMALLNQWYNEGLISPNFHSFSSGEDYDAGQHTDGLGAYLLNISALITSEQANNNPDTDWEPCPRTKKTEDQVIKFGYAKAADDFSYGSCCVNGKCENIALACSWIDWYFSEFGSDFASWGPEGYLWEYNDKGERRLTEWCLNHEATPSWLMCIYGSNGLLNCHLFFNWRNYYTDTGVRQLACYDVLTIKGYKGEYDWPSGTVKLDDDEREETTSLFADLNTYFSENYNSFIDGTKPMSEWDSYIQGLYDFGYERVKEIYQAAYDRYLAEGLV